MSKRRNGCSGKVRHKSQVGAIIAAKRMKNAGVGTYPCSKCGGWHVGSSDKPWKVQARLDQLLGKRA